MDTFGRRPSFYKLLALIPVILFVVLCRDVTAVTLTAVAPGGAFTCAITSAANVVCWGDNTRGQLGDGTKTSRNTPAAVIGLSGPVTALAAGAFHSCALTIAGAVHCWGDNQLGRLGDGTTSERLTAVAVSGLSSGVVAIAAGWNHSCAVTGGGAVQCWGANLSGELGDGTQQQRVVPTTVVGLSSGVKAVQSFRRTTCAITTTGTLWCWGRNDYGQAGDPSKIQRSTPVTVSGLLGGAVAVATGEFFTCALTISGAVQCWGRNDSGQLGDGTTIDRLTPVAVTGLPGGVTTIAAGESYACAMTGAGPRCWGNNAAGQLGDGTRRTRTTAIAVFGLSGAAAIAVGNETCVLTTAGEAVCWGEHPLEVLPDGMHPLEVVPVDVDSLSIGVAAVDAGGDSTCAVTTGGGVRCWGRNDKGQLGDGTIESPREPGAVIGLPNAATAVAASPDRSCALTTGGAVSCWGDNTKGQLGDGTTTNRTMPMPVVGLSSGITAIAGGVDHTCALTTGGAVKCWGLNSYGQLGDGTLTTRTAPVTVNGLSSGVVAIAAGPYNTCAISAAGGAFCWGSNDTGALGDGTTTGRVSPVPVVGLSSGVIAIAAGNQHTCALLDTGIVECWGSGSRLGDGTNNNGLTPVTVIGLTGATALAAGGAHTCAVKSGGALACWGSNDKGQIGDGTTNTRLTPVMVSGLSSGVAAVTAGSTHTCALMTDGSLRCWGLNNTGQLGIVHRTVTLAPPLCTSFALSPFSVLSGPLGDSRIVSVIGSPVGCAGGDWAASGNGAWITVSPTAGNGPGFATVTWTYNVVAAPRSDTATIAGASFDVSQTAAPVSDPRRDFNGDGWMDLLFRHTETGELALWSMAGPTRISSQMLNPPRANTNWRVAGLGDVNGDGSPDIIWQEETAGDLVVWFMSGVTRTSYAYLSIPRPTDPLWKVVAVADMNGDTKPDLIWQHSTSGAVAAWMLDGTTVTSRVSLNPGGVADTNWKVVGAADFDYDGQTDLLWKHATDGSLVVWHMSGIVRWNVTWVTPNRLVDNDWEVAAIGDVRGEGSTDIIFQNKRDGRLAVWLMTFETRLQVLMLSPDHVADPRWRIVAPK